MDRRSFLARAAGGAVLAGAGRTLFEATGVAAGNKPTTGFAVGQVLPDLPGLDQYNRSASLKDKARRWTLLDVCAWWCGPCQQSAQLHAPFSEYMNSQGLPFRVLTVLIDSFDLNGITAQPDAELWSDRFHLTDDLVLHSGGVASAPLRSLARDLALANGQPAGYPTYALIDPAGLIRYFRQGADLNDLQAKLAEFSGKTLTHDWTIPDAQENFRVAGVRPLTVTGSLSDGTAVADTHTELAGTAAATEIDSNTLFPTIVDETYRGFALDSSLTLNATLDPPPNDGWLYLLELGPEVSVASLFDDGFGGGSLGAFNPTPAALQWQPNGSVDFVCEPFGNTVSADTGLVPAAAVRFKAYYVSSTAYYVSGLLDTAVANDAVLSSAVKGEVRDLLGSLRDQLGKRDFTKAASKAAKALTRLQQGGATGPLLINATSLASYLAGQGHP